MCKCIECEQEDAARLTEPTQLDVDLYTAAVYTATKYAKLDRNSAVTGDWLRIADSLRPTRFDIPNN